MRHGSDAGAGFRQAVIDGLSGPDKSIPCKYLYDDFGSALFERICEQPEYYLTRVETRLLERHAGAVRRLAGPSCRIIEFGSGNSRKSRILLEAMGDPRAYVPVDVSHRHLMRAAASLAADYPGKVVQPVCADFLGDFVLPSDPGGGGRTLVFFPGSTIGNLSPPAACAFLRRCRAMLGPDGLLLVGVDTKKAPEILNAAYNDAAGFNAAFNLNLLARINRELGGRFDLDGFEHSARYDARQGCVAIHIISRRDQEVPVDGAVFRFGRREPIHTEDSYKYSVEEFLWLAGEAGLRPEATWVDDEGLFSVHCLRPRMADG